MDWIRLADLGRKEGFMGATTEKGILPKSDVYFMTPSSLARRLFFYTICAGHFFYEDSYCLEREDYHSYLLLEVRAGKAKIRSGKKEATASKGDLVLLDCHIPHGYASMGNLETVWLHFDGNGAKNYYEMLHDSQDACVILKEAKEASRLLRILYENPLLQEAERSLLLNQILLQFFMGRSLGIAHGTQEREGSEYAAEDGDEPRSHPDGWRRQREWVEDTMAYMREHFREPICIADLAGLVSLSEAYYNRVFKKMTGFTPYEYLLNTRITEAKMLLKGSDKTIKEVAYSCGFTSESNFIHAFKEKTNMTPGVFRNTRI